MNHVLYASRTARRPHHSDLSLRSVPT